MNNIEQRMLDAINDETLAEQCLPYDDNYYVTGKDKAAKQCASIAEDIAIEFADWCEPKFYYIRLYTTKELFNLFLEHKNKQQ